MKRFSARKRTAIILVSVAAFSIILGATYWAFEHWRVVRFTPACQIYEDPPEVLFYVFKDLQFLEGEPTEEFWREATGRLPDYLDWVLIEREKVKVDDGRIYTTWSQYFHVFEFMKKFEREREEWFYTISKDVAEHLYEERVASGSFEGIDLQPYKVQHPYLLKNLMPADCGFMKELIMKGGQFASE